MYTGLVKTLNITEFRAQCLQLLEQVPTEGILITKRGQPVAKIVPVRRSPAELIGNVPSLATDPDDDLFSTGIRWNAES